MARPTIDAEDLASPTAKTATRTDAKHVIERTGRTYTTGVGLKESEIDVLDDWAHRLSVSRHALMVWCLRYGMDALVSGQARPEVEKTTTTKLRMP